MDLGEMISKPSIMGVVGVILGAAISIVINYVNNKQNYKFQKEQNRIEKVEQTAIDFLFLMQKIATYNLMISSNTDDESMVQQREQLGKEIMDLNEQVKAKMQFYFEQHEYNIAMEICEMVEPKSEEEATIFNKRRKEKMDSLIQNIKKRGNAR